MIPHTLHEAATEMLRGRTNDPQLSVVFDHHLRRYCVTDGRDFHLRLETPDGEFLDASRNHAYIVHRVREHDLSRRRLIQQQVGRNRILTLK